MSEKKNEMGDVKDGQIWIVVAQRGWVCVGEIYHKGSQVSVKNSSIIRRWGTTKGLGEIAKDGPTDKTVLDPSGLISIHELAIVMMMGCDQEKWKPYIK